MCYESSLLVSPRVKADGGCDVCVHVCGVCTRAGLRADVCGLARRFCGSQMGWICRVGTEGLAEIQAISPTSIITHNYTLNGLKNRVTTNQQGSHGRRENEVSFMALFTYKSLSFLGFLLPISAFVLQLCLHDTILSPQGCFYF